MRLSAVEAAVFAPVRAALRARARDVTAQAEGRSCVVIAPHADDETLGCGATIARKRAAGRRVRVVVVTDGRRSHDSAAIDASRLVEMRRAEAVAACGVLGVPAEDVVLLGVEDQAVEGEAPAVAERLAAIVAEVSPQEVYSPSPLDRNVDHRAIGRIVRDLARGGRIACPVMEYPVWFWTLRTWVGDGPLTARMIPSLAMAPLRAAAVARVRMVRTEGFLETKRAALAKHRSQVENLTGEPGWGVLEAGFLRSFFRGYELFFEVG